MEPSLLVEDLVGVLVVFVISLHDVLAADKDLAGHALRVFGVDLHFEQAFEEPAARTCLELVVGGEADQRGAFGHAVADRDRELDLHQERLGLLVHRRAADDENSDVAAEGVHQFLADHRVDGRVEQRNLHGDRHGTFFQHREHLLAVDLFEDHRHAADDRGFHDGHRLQQDFRRRNLPQQGDVPTDGQRCEEVECAAVGVCQRQERQRAAAFLEIPLSGLGVDHRHREHHVAREVVHREHHALRIAGRSRGVVEQDDLVVGNFGIFDVVDAESARVLGAVVLHDVALELGERLAVALVDRMEVREREYGLDLLDLVLLDHVPEVVAQEQQAAFRVVDDMDDVRRGEILEDRHDHCSVGDGSHVGDAPAWVVAADERDFVALLDPGFLEKQVDFRNLLGHFIVRKGLALEIVGQRRHLPILPKTRFVYFQQVFL